MNQYQILVKEKQLQQGLTYKNHIVLKYTIQYPRFISGTFYTITNKLNHLYRTKALMYLKKNVMNLYQMAIADFEYSTKNQVPFREFEAFTSYQVPYNQNCTLSLYFDQYEYTGGAHGLTLRNSDTWDLLHSKRMELSDFFPKDSNATELIINSILEQIKEQIETGSGMYFDNYEQLVRDTFRLNNFYLTTEGLAIYFQQYDIAPYAAGMPTFVLPYAKGGPLEPIC